MSIDRRDFLKRTAAAAAALTLGACDDDDAQAIVPDAAAPDAAQPDAALDAGADAGPLDAGQAGDLPDAEMPEPEWPVTKGPWVHLRGTDGALIRFETGTDAPRTVHLDGPGGPQTFEPEVVSQQVDWKWPPGQTWERADRPGRYAVQSVLLGGLTPGQYTWRIDTETGPITGGFRIIAPDAPIRVGWIADTMWPVLAQVAAGLAGSAPDVVLHGGDIQYRSNPGDTWRGMFNDLAATMRQAPMHFCVGNHESETETELEEQYRRLFGAQSEGNQGDYHRVEAGPIRALMVNSESGLLADEAQLAWLEQELAAAAADPAVRQTIVAFHRPFYTFSKHAGGLPVRERLHPLFVQHGVKLVLNGHVHAYERFEVDGVTYVVDGGGGAALYDPNEDLEEIQATRPEEVPLRQFVSDSHGWTMLEVAADGAIAGMRYERNGEIIDQFQIQP